jgi:hypothetical protein
MAPSWRPPQVEQPAGGNERGNAAVAWAGAHRGAPRTRQAKGRCDPGGAGRQGPRWRAGVNSRLRETRITTAPASAPLRHKTDPGRGSGEHRSAWIPAIRAAASYLGAPLSGAAAALPGPICAFPNLLAGSRQYQGLGGVRRVPGASSVPCMQDRRAYHRSVAPVRRSGRPERSDGAEPRSNERVHCVPADTSRAGWFLRALVGMAHARADHEGVAGQDSWTSPVWLCAGR